MHFEKFTDILEYLGSHDYAQGQAYPQKTSTLAELKILTKQEVKISQSSKLPT